MSFLNKIMYAKYQELLNCSLILLAKYGYRALSGESDILA